MIGLRPSRYPFGGRVDRATTERLLSGHLDPDDAPPRYAAVARIIRATTAAPSSAELSMERAAVSAAVRLLRQPQARPVERLRRRHRRARVRRLGSLAVAALLLTTGMAAADVLPDRARDLLADALSVAGIDVQQGPRGSADPAKLDRPASTGAEIARLATTTQASGVEKGALISRWASGGISRAGQHGRAVEVPERDRRADAPGGRGNGPPKDPSRGSGTASDASEAAHATGAEAARERSNGRGSSEAAEHP